MEVRGDPTNLHASAWLHSREAVQRAVEKAKRVKSILRPGNDIYGPITVQLRFVSEPVYFEISMD